MQTELNRKKGITMKQWINNTKNRNAAGLAGQKGVVGTTSAS